MNRLMIFETTGVFMNSRSFMNEPPISKSPLCIYEQGGGFKITLEFRDATPVRKGQNGTRNQDRGQIMHPITKSRVSTHEPDQTTIGESSHGPIEPNDVHPQKWASQISGDRG
jgi:hypothetical protein